jgi:hypothetical protein
MRNEECKICGRPATQALLSPQFPEEEPDPNEPEDFYCDDHAQDALKSRPGSRLVAI